jgi:hypothetical protein
MKKLIEIVKRYKVFLLLALINTAVVVVYPVIGIKSLEITWANTLEMLAVIPPIFVCSDYLMFGLSVKLWSNIWGMALEQLGF